MDESALLNYFSTEMGISDATAPLHRRLRSVIENAVKTGVLKPSAVLPGERVMAEGLCVSRVTVRKAIELLVTEGLLHRHHGARTEVGSRVEKSLSTDCVDLVDG